VTIDKSCAALLQLSNSMPRSQDHPSCHYHWLESCWCQSADAHRHALIRDVAVETDQLGGVTGSVVEYVMTITAWYFVYLEWKSMEDIRLDWWNVDRSICPRQSKMKYGWKPRCWVGMLRRRLGRGSDW